MTAGFLEAGEREVGTGTDGALESGQEELNSGTFGKVAHPAFLRSEKNNQENHITQINKQSS